MCQNGKEIKHLLCLKKIRARILFYRYILLFQSFVYFQWYRCQQNKCYPQRCLLAHFEAIWHSISAVANLLAHNNISLISYSDQISLQSVVINCSFSDNLTPLGVTFILLAMVPSWKFGEPPPHNHSKMIQSIRGCLQKSGKKVTAVKCHHSSARKANFHTSHRNDVRIKEP